MGHYICSRSVTDIASGWWEGPAIIGLDQYPILEALNQIRSRTPFDWFESHTVSAIRWNGLLGTVLFHL